MSKHQITDAGYAQADLRMTFDTCRASDTRVGSDPWTLAAAKTFLAARALIALGVGGHGRSLRLLGPCGHSSGTDQRRKPHQFPATEAGPSAYSTYKT
jgi:hypothetical protein